MLNNVFKLFPYKPRKEMLHKWRGTWRTRGSYWVNVVITESTWVQGPTHDFFFLLQQGGRGRLLKLDTGCDGVPSLKKVARGGGGGGPDTFFFPSS